MSLVRCPRCEAAAIVTGNGALSRVTRDDGAPVTVCDRCGQREGLYGGAADQIQLAGWPVPVDRLLAEERCLIDLFRGAELAYITAEELDG